MRPLSLFEICYRGQKTNPSQRPLWPILSHFNIRLGITLIVELLNRLKAAPGAAFELLHLHKFFVYLIK